MHFYDMCIFKWGSKTGVKIKKTCEGQYKDEGECGNEYTIITFPEFLANAPSRMAEPEFAFERTVLVGKALVHCKVAIFFVPLPLDVYPMRNSLFRRFVKYSTQKNTQTVAFSSFQLWLMFLLANETSHGLTISQILGVSLEALNYSPMGWFQNSAAPRRVQRGFDAFALRVNRWRIRAQRIQARRNLRRLGKSILFTAYLTRRLLACTPDID